MPTNPPIRVLNIDIDDLTEVQLLQNLKEGVLFTPNIDHLIKLQKNRAFYEAYQEADYRTCDSRIIQLVSPFFFSKKIREQIAGSDFFPNFCRFHRNNPDIQVFLLGGSTAKEATLAEVRLNEEAGRDIVVDAYSPPFGFEKEEAETEKILELIRNSGANVLAVGVGAPKQELWIQRHKKDLPEVKIFMGIGKTIDFIAGTSRRAPKWMTQIGLEWLYRLGQEPLRLAKRYLLDDLPFFWLAFTQKMNWYRDPFNKS